MVVYISGPITGTADYKERFKSVEKQLQMMGYSDIINPVDLDCVIPPDTSYANYMHICKALIDISDAVYMTRG